jgi:hypothetical protein
VTDEILVEIACGADPDVIELGMDADDDDDDDDDVDVNDRDPTPVKLVDARMHASNIITFMSNNSSTFTAAEHGALQSVLGKMNKMTVANISLLQQPTLHRYFQPVHVASASNSTDAASTSAPASTSAAGNNDIAGGAQSVAVNNDIAAGAQSADESHGLMKFGRRS